MFSCHVDKDFLSLFLCSSLSCSYIPFIVALLPMHESCALWLLMSLELVTNPASLSVDCYLHTGLLALVREKKNSIIRIICISR